MYHINSLLFEFIWWCYVPLPHRDIWASLIFSVWLLNDSIKTRRCLCEKVSLWMNSVRRKCAQQTTLYFWLMFVCMCSNFNYLFLPLKEERAPMHVNSYNYDNGSVDVWHHNIHQAVKLAGDYPSFIWVNGSEIWKGRNKGRSLEIIQEVATRITETLEEERRARKEWRNEGEMPG